MDVFRIQLPPLREREEDLLLLIDNMISMYNQDFSKLGKIQDISMGGLTVRYFEKEAWDCKTIKVDLVVSDVDFSLDRIPIEIAYDVEQYTLTPYRILFERQCGLKFGTLTEQQFAQLSNYLQDPAA